MGVYFYFSKDGKYQRIFLALVNMNLGAHTSDTFVFAKDGEIALGGLGPEFGSLLWEGISFGCTITSNHNETS